MKGIYDDLIVNGTSCIKYVPFHEISQDHIELFFANIRSHGGSNDNPTPRSFESIYKKLLVHSELLEVSTGNCVPLEKISILNCSSSSSTNNLPYFALQIINLTTTAEDKEESPIGAESQKDLEVASICLSQFAESAIEYIAGFVASSLMKHLKCKICIGALISLNQDKSSLIAYRDEGGLIYPSRTVTKVCRRCERIKRKI